jgi:hypothetical protein
VGKTIRKSFYGFWRGDCVHGGIAALLRQRRRRRTATLNGGNVLQKIELLNKRVENLTSSDKNMIAKGSIQLEGRDIGYWEVRSESRWSASLQDGAVNLSSDSRDDLIEKIAGVVGEGLA